MIPAVGFGSDLFREVEVSVGEIVVGGHGRRASRIGLYQYCTSDRLDHRFRRLKRVEK